MLWSGLCISRVGGHVAHPHPGVVHVHVAKRDRRLRALAPFLLQGQANATGAAGATKEENDENDCSGADTDGCPVPVPVSSLLLLLIPRSPKLPGEGIDVSAIGLRQLSLGHTVLVHVDGRKQGVVESLIRSNSRVPIFLFRQPLLGLVCLCHLLQGLVHGGKDHRVRLRVVRHRAAVHVKEQLALASAEVCDQ